MYLQHCLIIHLLWSTDIMRGNRGTSCLLGIPTPGPFCCLKLDCTAFVLVTGGDLSCPFVTFACLCFSIPLCTGSRRRLYRLQTPPGLPTPFTPAPDATRAPDALHLGSRRRPGSRRQLGSRRHIYLGSDTAFISGCNANYSAPKSSDARAIFLSRRLVFPASSRAPLLSAPFSFPPPLGASQLPVSVWYRAVWPWAVTPWEAFWLQECSASFLMTLPSIHTAIFRNTVWAPCNGGILFFCGRCTLGLSAGRFPIGAGDGES